MKRLLFFSICLVFGFSSFLSASQSARTLTLTEAVRLAVENNLDVRAERYTPAQYEADINRNRAIYDPRLTAKTGVEDTVEPKPTFEERIIDTRSVFFDFSLSQLLWSGATAALSFNNSHNKTNEPTFIEHYRESGLSLSVSQPLLKNRGREVTEENIRISQLGKYASLERFKNKLLSIIARVRNDYFKLYRLREELAVRRVSLELATTILTETKARVAAGVLPALEILNAEFGVVTREKELNEAEKALQDQADILRLLLQLDLGTDITPTDVPTSDFFDFSEDAAIQRAFSRPDILEQKKNLELAEFRSRMFSHKLLPDLSLNTSAGLNTLQHDRGRDQWDLGSSDNFGWSIGLQLTYPIGNTAAENEYRKSRLISEQTRLQLKSLEESAANEVRAAFRAIQTGTKQIEVTNRGVAFAEKRLYSFIRKNEAGLATTKEVLDVETELAAAKSNRIAALVSYTNALTGLWQATGELLERQGIVIDEKEATRLYDASK